MKNILIMGAGVYQVPLIKKAREMGHKAIVVSPIGNYPGLALADEVIHLDTRDHVAVLEKAKRIGIDAVLTTGTDVAVPTIGYLVDELGLPGTGYAAAQRSMDKALMKQCFAENGIKTAKFSVVETLDELKQCANDMGYPVMVKAVDSSGSRGITQVLTSDALDSAYSSAKAISKSQKVICEQYLDGHEIGADTIIVGDDVVEVFLHEKYVTPPPVSAPIGHSMPLILPERVEERTKNLLRKATEALGLKNTIANADVMIVDNEPYLIEMSARMGGTCIPEVISLYTGLDIYALLIEMSINRKVVFDSDLYLNRCCLAMLITSSDSGVIKYNVDSPFLIDKNISILFDYNPGDKVRKFEVGPDRLGQIIVASDSIDGCFKKIKDVNLSLNVEVD